MLRKTITVAAVLCMLLPSVAFADLHYGSVVHPIIDREVSMGWIPWGGSTVETDNLAPAGADTVLFVFNKQNNQWVLAGWDDDSGAGYASKVTGIGGTQLRIIVIAFSPSFAGTCNVKVNGAVVASGPFGGEIVHRQDDSWDVGDVFTIIGDHTETPHYPLQDSLLYILPYEVGGKLQSDDDSSLNRQATVTATEANDGQWSTHSLVVAPYPNTGDGAFLLHQRRVNYTDADGDGINSFDETELGTSDTDTDSDGDGLPDYQELVGVPDPAGTAGAYDASLELRAYYYATPDAPDVFIQYDYYQYSPPNALQSDWLVSMFTNDTAYSGKTVYVHYETVHAFAAVRYLGEYDCQYLSGHPHPEYWGGLATLRDTYLDPLKQSFFRYAVRGTRYYGWNTQDDSGGPGCQLLDGTRGRAFSLNILILDASRGVLEHETGHGLGLMHYPGGPDLPRSVMNYKWESGFPYNGATKWSYSNGTAQPLCQSGHCPGEDGGCDCNEWAEIHF